MRKTDEEIVREIMEAGYGSYGYDAHKPGLLGRAAKLGLTAAGYAAKKTHKAYKNTDFAKSAEGKKAFSDVWAKLRKDYRRFAAAGDDHETAKALLIDFGHAMYQTDFTAFANAASGQPASARDEHPAHPPIEPEPILARKGDAEAPTQAAPQAQPTPAPAAEPEADEEDSRVLRRDKKNPRDPGPADWHPHEPLHAYMDREGKRLDAADAEERRKELAKRNVKNAAESYEDKSFSQIVAEADAADADPMVQAAQEAEDRFMRTALRKIAMYIASSPRRTDTFLKNNQVWTDNQPGSRDDAPAQKGRTQAKPQATAQAKPKERSQPQQAPQAAPQAAPAQVPAPAAPALTRDSLNTEIAKIAPIDRADIDAIHQKLSQVEGAQAMQAFSSPQEIEVAKAIAAAVVKLLK